MAEAVTQTLPAALRDTSTLVQATILHAVGISVSIEDVPAAKTAEARELARAAFGSAQPELAAFKSEVQRVVDSGAQNAQNNGVTRLGGPRGGRPERPDFDA